MTRIVLVDDQELLRSGIAMVLDNQEDLEVVGEAADGREGVAIAGELDPDIVLMDVRMPVMDGVEATRQIVASGCRARVIVLTTFDVDEHVYAALRAGASGFLLKDAAPEALLSAIRAVAAGEAVIAPSATRRLLEKFGERLPAPGDDGPSPADDLTSRETEVVVAVASGLSNAEIAGELFMAEATVKTHVSNVLAKLGLRDRVQIVIFAYEHRLVRLG